MKPRKILHISRVEHGGVAVVVDHLARGLDRNRYEPIVFFDTPNQSHIRDKLVESDIKTIGLTKPIVGKDCVTPKLKRNKDIVARLETSFGKRASSAYFSIKRAYEFFSNQIPRIRSFMRVIRENGIEIVHTHNDIIHGKPEILAAWLTGKRCISHNHGYSELTHFDKAFARFVDAFIYISNDLAEHHIAQGKPKAKGVVIHNGVDMTAFTRPYDTTLIRRELSSAPDEILVGLPGRISHWKGQDYFLRAIAEATNQIPDLKGVIIGDVTNDYFGYNRQYLKKLLSLLKSLNIEDKVLFTGFRSDVPRIISTLDVVVHASSTREPFGLVVIEGMAAGKPVVATGAGGVLDIIEDGVNGMLVPCKDSKALAKAIVHIISNKERAKQMGLAAREHVASKFTIQGQVTAIQQLYDSILGIRRQQ